MNKILGIYLFLLALLLGVEFCCGAFTAPTIFRPENTIGSGILTHFQSGQMMTAIFLKMNKILIAVSLFSFVFEMVNLANNREQSFALKFSSMMMSAIILILALMFILYFTDWIVSAQAGGPEATQTAEFAKVHKGSEWCMKIIMLMQAALFFVKFYTQKR